MTCKCTRRHPNSALRFCKRCPFSQWISHQVKARASICFLSLSLLLRSGGAPPWFLWSGLQCGPFQQNQGDFSKAPHPNWCCVLGPMRSTRGMAAFPASDTLTFYFCLHFRLLENEGQQHYNEWALRSHDGLTRP